jgi:hypothetical protein
MEEICKWWLTDITIHQGDKYGLMVTITILTFAFFFFACITRNKGKVVKDE